MFKLNADNWFSELFFIWVTRLVYLIHFNGIIDLKLSVLYTAKHNGDLLQSIYYDKVNKEGKKKRYVIFINGVFYEDL
jgi:hypothetical protein